MYNQYEDKFIHLVFKKGFLGSINGIKKILNEDSGVRKLDPMMVPTSEWYRSLDETSRENVGLIIRKTVELSVYSMLLIMDNEATGQIDDEYISDIAVYIQTYKDLASQARNKFLSNKRINSISNNSDLHDRFIEILKSQWNKEDI